VACYGLADAVLGERIVLDLYTAEERCRDSSHAAADSALGAVRSELSAVLRAGELVAEAISPSRIYDGAL
jgi:hypothetical protein